MLDVVWKQLRCRHMLPSADLAVVTLTTASKEKRATGNSNISNCSRKIGQTSPVSTWIPLVFIEELEVN